MSTITRENLTESSPASDLATVEAKRDVSAVFAWIVVSLAILVAAAVLGQAEDEQVIRADDTRTQTVVVSGD